MRDKLNRFIENTQGQFIEVSSREAIYQCMDLAYNWIFALDIPKATIQHGAAYEVYTAPNSLTKQYFEIIPNTPDFVPQAGDLVVWGQSYGKYGHIGIAIGDGNTSKFWVYEQNNPLGTNAHVQERSYTGVIGVLRPNLPYKVATELLITDQTRIPQLEGREVQQIVSEFKAKDARIYELEKKVASFQEIINDNMADLAEKDRKYDKMVASYEEEIKLLKVNYETKLLAKEPKFSNPIATLFFEMAKRLG